MVPGGRAAGVGGVSYPPERDRRNDRLNDDVNSIVTGFSSRVTGVIAVGLVAVTVLFGIISWVLGW